MQRDPDAPPLATRSPAKVPAAPSPCERSCSGSGAARLALVLADARCGDAEAAGIYQDLLRGLVAQLEKDPWQLDRALLDELLAERFAAASRGAR
jgi:hypothetical protein